MSTLTAQWRPYFSAADALDGALNGRSEILTLIGEALDQCEALMLLAQYAPDYERRDHATIMLATHLSEKLGYDTEMIRDILREVAGLQARFRWSQHQARLRAQRDGLAKWRSCIETYARDLANDAERKLETALVGAGFLMDG